jgi:two-component system cell cycle sensor histidine kinase/response regulator CckA
MNNKTNKQGRLVKTFDETADGLERMSAEGMCAEEKLKRIAGEWQATFDSITDQVMIIDSDFRIVRGNKASSDFFDVSPDSLRSGRCFSMMHESDAPLESCPLRKMLATGSHEEEEVFCESRGKWLLISADPIVDASGMITGAVHIVKNISDRKRVQDAVNNERLRFHNLVENAPFGMVLINKNGYTITYVNSYFKRFFGYGIFDIPDVGSWFQKAYPDPEYRNGVISSWSEDLKNGSGIHKQRTHSIRCHDGSKREVNFSTVLFASGEILLCCEDVTERTKMEEQLTFSRKMDAIGALAGGIAHDFNNILMAILGYTSILLVDMEAIDPNHEKLKIIEDQVQRGIALTSQLLGFARGGMYETKTTDLNHLVGKSSEMFGRTKKEIAVCLKHEKELWTVEVNQVQMEQVFLNLFLNAWHAMPGGGDLYLETRNVFLDEMSAPIAALRPGEYVCVSIRDTGIGIDEDIRHRIFEPFFTTKGMGRGTGLGLAAAYGVVKNHGGAIQVHSEKGKGTTFNVYIPASDKKLINIKPAVRDILKGSGTILFVDDQDSVLKVGKGLLETLGYTVLLANSGKDAMNLYRDNKENIDLVILDMVMPAMSGGETYRALKDINPGVIAILSSGYCMNGEAAKIIGNGCNGFIQKPFSIIELSKKIHEVLHGAAVDK